MSGATTTTTGTDPAAAGGGADAASAADLVDPRLLEILVCPLTKGPLRLDRAQGELVSERAGLAYPIRDGIPVMLPDEARRLDPGGR